jgi:BirA family biotin operon repressor/biotin-[acetyl-CoA-carboxylase] ligase
MVQVLGKETDLQDVLHLLCNNLENRYLQLKGGRHAELKSDYLGVMYRFNAPHEFEYGGRRFTARITDVADDGKLVLDYGNNLVGRYDFKTIRFVI